MPHTLCCEQGTPEQQSPVGRAHQCSKNCIIKQMSSPILNKLVQFASVIGFLSPFGCSCCFPEELSREELSSRATCRGSSSACQGLWQLLRLAWPPAPSGHLSAQESSINMTKLCRQQGRHEGSSPPGPQGKS